MLLWGVIERLRGGYTDESDVQQRGQPTSPARVMQSISLEQIAADGMELTGGGAPFELSGQIKNESETTLRSVTLVITRRDCFEGALDPSGCVVLWQDRHWMQISVPAGEAREFSTSVWMRGSAPRPRGTPEDSVEVVAATGESAKN